MPPKLTLKHFFPNLEALDLSDNQIRTIASTNLTTVLPRLLMLSLARNHIDSLDEIFSLSGHPALRELDLQGNPLPFAKKRLLQLEKLMLHGTHQHFATSVTYLTSTYQSVPSLKTEEI